MISGLFSTYLQLGFEHISDIQAYDHIVFIIALCAIYRLRQWKQVLVLVTAFTIGHSLTLGLAVMDIIGFPSRIIELLIPVTIIATSLYNVSIDHSKIEIGQKAKRQFRINYSIAAAFGLIHGMGFSNFLRASLLPGEGNSIWQQLLAFNIGIELGQLLIVACILLLSYLLLDILKFKQASWNLFVSGAAAGIALVLLLEQL